MLKYTIDKLLKRRGLPLDYLFFCSHHPEPDGTIGPGCLSQWWPCRFRLGDIAYPTAEHYMMAEKARVFHDQEAHNRILATTNPKLVKQFGRAVRNYREDLWSGCRLDIVIRGNHAKFSQNPELLQYLLSTNNKVLVETAHYDRVWGIGLRADDPAAQDPMQWCGQNLLGFALMVVRDLLDSNQGG